MRGRQGSGRFTVAAAVAIVAVALLFARELPAAPAAEARPNIVVLMTDDQTLESMRVLPKVRSLLGDHGVTFADFFANYPLCCPSRTTYFTGQYAHNHHVLYNRGSTGGFRSFRGQGTTMPVALQRAGYHTIHIGKFLNGYGKGAAPARAPVPPGWDDWNASVDPSTYRYYGYVLNENGRPHRYTHRYQTDEYADLAVAKIRQEAAGDDPFFLDVAFLAPHAVERETSGLDAVDEAAVGYPHRRHGIRYPVPAPKYRHRFRRAALPAGPAFDQADVSKMPQNIRDRPRFARSEIADIRTDYRRRLATLLSVDDAVERIVGALRDTGLLDRTVIFFMSDNGYFHGEHRIPFGKYLPYEPSIRVPLVVRGPSIASGVTTDALASNVDIAPTILELAGATPLRPPDGRSLVPVLHDPTGATVHREILLESGRNDVGAPVYHGIRTARWKYVVYDDGDRELYDLATDPAEVHNLAGERVVEGVEARLAAKLASVEACAAAACP
ncbi:MAG TPA: sulfatase [Acidimicrobiia bacterium]|nr:sulfatase [Acidimicrobiia bacterium]